jgi:hypothetical protein
MSGGRAAGGAAVPGLYGGDRVREAGAIVPVVSAPSQSRRSLRTAAILLLIASAVDAITFGVQAHWGWRPTTLAIAETGLQALLGHALLRFNRSAVIPTVAFLLAVVLLTIGRTALNVDLPLDPAAFVTVYSVVLLVGCIRVIPPLMLLYGRQNTVRYAVALAIFVLRELIDIATNVLAVYASHLPHFS